MEAQMQGRIQTLEWCPRCDGEGTIVKKVPHHLPFHVVCPQCEGRRLVIQTHG